MVHEGGEAVGGLNGVVGGDGVGGAGGGGLTSLSNVSESEVALKMVSLAWVLKRICPLKDQADLTLGSSANERRRE